MISRLLLVTGFFLCVPLRSRIWLPLRSLREISAGSRKERRARAKERKDHLNPLSIADRSDGLKYCFAIRFSGFLSNV
jgi:hypothetical protein